RREQECRGWRAGGGRLTSELQGFKVGAARKERPFLLAVMKQVSNHQTKENCSEKPHFSKSARSGVSSKLSAPAQKEIRPASWIIRGSKAEVIWPKTPLFGLTPPAPPLNGLVLPLATPRLMTPGLRKLVWLKMLKNSARISSFTRSVRAVVFENAKSKLI